MANPKRSWKLQEFTAHGADVNCLGLGHKSGRVMVTGGEDRKVNLWSVGKAHCIMSLSGHTTTIEAVRFGHAEELVVAGSQSGALKVWDLEQAKILRTLTGHKAGIKSLDFHPYGEYTASGSMDCNVKLWDIRRKGCIYTYKGHTGSVSCLRFSPDGRWIASASEDGLVKLWDLTAGKLITDLKLHKGPVNTVEFHPHELLIASGSNDRTIKFWDLETFQLVSSTEADTNPIRCIAFHPDGMCLYSGGKDVMKVYGWEPIKCYDTVAVGWGEVCDLSITNTQLIAASFNKTNVTSFVVDLEKVGPLGGNGAGSNSFHREPSSLNNSRKSFVTERPPTQSTRQASEPKKVEEPGDKSDDPEDPSGADIQNPAEYRELFQVNSRQAHAAPKKVEKFQPPPEETASSESQPVRQRAVEKKESTNRNVPQRPVERSPQGNRNVPQRPVERSPPPQQQRSPREEPGGINAEDFLPRQPAARAQGATSEDDLHDLVTKGHNPMMTVLAGRSRNLQIVRAMWTSGNTKTAIDSAVSMHDPAVLVDVLNVLNMKTSLWNLDLCTVLLPQLKELLNSKYECYVQAAGQAVKLVMRNLGQTIKNNISSAPSIGVDISREERQRKCTQCYTNLMEIRSMMEKRQDASGKLTNLYKEILLLISTLD
ncbi:katanin p80 WD40 repeat-containing subunit B1-like isoform X2 [Littorina saxatilis]|uniref:Katanin p80 WD40 repeat-containing subunit B1 n=1 Tax=Littorina saxatilis TaxID=31220 RepID=A0AAN9GN66_9CAEN